MKKRLTIAKHLPATIQGHYYPVREMKQDCKICIHYSACRDLSKNKRYIVLREKGSCILKKEPDTCGCFERIPELRGKNMTPLEKIYFKMYTRKYLTDILRRHFRDPDAVYTSHRLPAEQLALIIATQECRKSQRNILNKQKRMDKLR